jgi:hypothetical protein
MACFTLCCSREELSLRYTDGFLSEAWNVASRFPVIRRCPFSPGNLLNDEQEAGSTRRIMNDTTGGMNFILRIRFPPSFASSHPSQLSFFRSLKLFD